MSGGRRQGMRSGSGAKPSLDPTPDHGPKTESDSGGAGEGSRAEPPREATGRSDTGRNDTGSDDAQAAARSDLIARLAARLASGERPRGESAASGQARADSSEVDPSSIDPLQVTEALAAELMRAANDHPASMHPPHPATSHPAGRDATDGYAGVHPATRSPETHPQPTPAPSAANARGNTWSPRSEPASFYRAGAAQDLAGIDPAELFRKAVAALWRNIPLALASAVVFAALGAAYAHWQEPRYTARASLIIDPRVDEGLSGLQVPTVLLADALVVDSEVEVLRSERLLRRVAARLPQPLHSIDTESGTTLSTLAVGVTAPTGAPETAAPATTPETAPDGALEARPHGDQGVIDLSNTYDIRREGTTFVVRISATTDTPDLSAELANLLAEEYIAQAREARLGESLQARDWLMGELATLGDVVRAAETRVERFRFENAIPDESAIGIVEQELAANETRLISARDDLRAARSELATLDRALADIATVPPGERARRAALHAQLVTALGGRGGLRTTQIEEELDRLRAARLAQIEIAEAAIAPLVERNEALQATLAEISEKQIGLRDLRRSAAAMQAQYENLLARLETTQSEGTFFRSNARIIEEATAPARPSSPESRMLAAAAGFGGLLIGLGLVFFREQIDDTLRSSDDVSNTLGLTCLGAVPRIGWRDRRATPTFLPDLGHLPRALRREVAAFTRAATEPHSFNAEVFRRTAIELRRPGVARGQGGVARGSAAVSGDTSGNTAALGSTAVRPMIVSAVSAVSGEGKSLFAANLAFFLAGQGARVLLIDADLRNPQLTRVLRPVGAARPPLDAGKTCPVSAAEPGLRTSDAGGSAASGKHPRPAMRAMPLAPGLALVHAGDGEDSLDVEQALDDITAAAPAWSAEGGLDRCDYIVLDTSPFGYVSDSAAPASQVDAGILVVRWGKTTAGTLRRLLVRDPVISERLIGAVLSRVRPTALRRHERLPSNPGYYRPRR